ASLILSCDIVPPVRRPVPAPGHRGAITMTGRDEDPRQGCAAVVLDHYPPPGWRSSDQASVAAIVRIRRRLVRRESRGTVPAAQVGPQAGQVGAVAAQDLDRFAGTVGEDAPEQVLAVDQGAAGTAADPAGDLDGLAAAPVEDDLGGRAAQGDA